jgi:hypothetical protein
MFVNDEDVKFVSDVIGVYLIFNVIIVKFCEGMIDFED